MGVQISCRLDSKVSEKETPWPTAETPRRSVSLTGTAERVCNRRGVPSSRPCAYVDINSSKVRRVSSRRFYIEEKRHSYCAKLSMTKQELHWTAFLGTRVLRHNSWSR